VTASEKIRRINNIFRDATPRQETSLVRINERLDRSLKPRGESLSDALHDAVLKRDGAKLGGVVGPLNFWKKDKEGTVNSRKVHRSIVEGLEKGQNVRGDRVPKGGEKGRAKAVGPGAGHFVHAQEGILDLLRRERGTKMARQGGNSIEGTDVEAPSCGCNSTQETGIKVFQDRRFSKVVRDLNIIHEERGDGVPSHPAGGRGVKKLCVLISLQGVSNFGPGLPI
jgi:hypothetical protein